MKDSTYKHAHSHVADKSCGCDHKHDHDHAHIHGEQGLSLGRRWWLAVLIVTGSLVLLKPFIIDQLFVRVTSYAVSASYKDDIRICRKIIALEPNNIRAWDSLGYAYTDSSQTDKAVAAFTKVLKLDPQDSGAASFELGRAFYGKGDYAKAIAYFERIRQSGPRAAAVLEADILKYRHGAMAFRSLNSMKTLYEEQLDSYRHQGDTAKVDEVKKELDVYKSKHSGVLF